MLLLTTLLMMLHTKTGQPTAVHAEGVMVNLNTGMGTGGDAMGDTLKNIELIWGSKQADTFVASEGADIIHGDGGSDTVSYEASKHGVDLTLNNGVWTGDANS